MQKLKNLNPLVLLFILLIPACWALFVPGFYGASDEVHIAWLYEMDQVLKLGYFPGRFVPDLSYAFGYPLFNFVFPLPYYLAELFHVIGFSFVDSIKMLFFLTIPVSAFLMYRLLKEVTNNHLAFVGALLYSYTPYRSVDIYVRGAIGEVVSFVFFPLIAWSILKLGNSQERKYVAIGGLSIGGLILSHNIAAYMMMPLFALLMAMIILTHLKKISLIINYCLMGLLGAVVSMFFWFPALTESTLMKYDTVFNFVDHFPTLSQLVKPYWGYGGSVPGPGDGMSFFLGGAQLVVLVTGVLYFLFDRKRFNTTQQVLSVWAMISIGIAIVMMNYRSIPIWNSVPFIPYFQFPWRFLMVTTFCIPLLVGAFENIRGRGIVVLGLIVLTVAVNGWYFRPQDFLGRTDSYFLDKYIPSSPVSEAYKQNQEEYLRLPKNAEKRPDQLMPRFYSDSGASIQTQWQDPLNAQAVITSTKSAIINYSKYKYPGWEADVDGLYVPTTSGKPYAQIQVFVPAGTHTVHISYHEPIYKVILDIISGAFMIGALLLLGSGVVKRYNGKVSR